MMPFLEGYSRYNQVIVENTDRLKTTFTYKWGIYAYRRIPFGLINVPWILLLKAELASASLFIWTI